MEIKLAKKITSVGCKVSVRLHCPGLDSSFEFIDTACQCDLLRTLHDFLVFFSYFSSLLLFSALCKLFAATVVGMSFNAPATEQGGWRPSKNQDDEPQCVVLTAESSPNTAGFHNGITVSPSDESGVIIGRIKETAARLLAPLMRDRKVALRANFNVRKFNLKAIAIDIDVFAGTDAISIERLFVQYAEYLIQHALDLSPD